MEIRVATTSDLPDIYAVDPITADEGDRRERLKEQVTTGRAIVAVLDDRVAGYAVLEYSFFGHGFISMLIVQKESRRKGVASDLIKRLEETCKTSKLFTSTNKSNQAMQALMQSLSYEESGTVYNLDEGDPELFYFKNLSENR